MKEQLKNYKYLALFAFVMAAGFLLDFLLGTGGECTIAFAMAAGVDGAGKHGNGDANTDVTREESPNLMRDPYDKEIVKMGFASTPINAMTRDMGSRQIKSMRYRFFSIDLRQIMDKVKAASVTVGQNADRKKPAKVEVEVYNPGIFDKTDVIVFRGVPGYDETGAEQTHIELTGRVCEVKDTTISVQFLNAKLTGDITVNQDTEIYILGHAASETDASTVPYNALPEDDEQFMQKFMVQSIMSNVMIESDKEVRWGEEDVKELLLQQFTEDVEKTYIFGVKSYTYDPITKLWTYTTSGFIEQMIKGGGHVIDIPKSEFNDEKIIDVMSEIFIGNSGSNTRYLYTGNTFATSLFKLPSIQKYQNVNDTVRKFEYDFRRIRMMNYTLLNVSHPLLDKMNMGNYALVMDRQYIQRRVFRSLKETQLMLEKTGAYDGRSTVWSEISSIVVKYPLTHGIIRITEG